MTKFLLILILAVTVEALIQYVKTIQTMLRTGEQKTALTQLAAIAASVLLCFAAGADLYTVLGVDFAFPWIGVLLTGVFVSRGANYAADFIKRLQNPAGFSEIVLENAGFMKSE